MDKIIYFVIALMSTLIGSMTGAAGGVIMKPIIDLISKYDAMTIGVLTGITLIAMSIVNVSGHILNKRKVELKFSILLTAGAIVGGVIGGHILPIIKNIMNSDSLLKAIQNIILLILIVLSLLYMHNKDKMKSFNLKSNIAVLVSGLALGMVSTFLGIGGGPMNVSVLVLLFAISTKDAAIYSIIIVLFSQFAKMSELIFRGDFVRFELKLLPFMVIGGVIGGYVGAKLNKKMPEKVIVFVFNAIQVFVIITTFINIISNI